MLADGTIARSGGHVIKNVAGYDLTKLVYGSLGSLALIAEVVVRLHPLPADSATMAATVDAATASRATTAVMASVLEPAAIEFVSDRDSGRLLLRVDGSPGYVRAAAEGVRQLLGTLGVEAGPLEPDAAQAAWEEQRLAVPGSDGDTVLRVSGLPSGMPELVRTAAGVSRGSSAWTSRSARASPWVCTPSGSAGGRRRTTPAPSPLSGSPLLSSGRASCSTIAPRPWTSSSTSSAHHRRASRCCAG